MKSKFLFVVIAIALMTLVSAAIYIEPWAQDQNGGNYSITNVYNVSSTYLEGILIGSVQGNISGNMDWSNLTNYPVACPGSSAITQLGDSVTCSDLWFNIAGDETITGNMTFSNSGILNLSFIESLDWTNITITNSQVTDYVEADLNVNSSSYWANLTNFNNTQMEDSSAELNIKESWLTTFGNAIWCALSGCTMTGNLIVQDDINATGNITGENVHLPSYLSTHTNASITAVEGVWLNVTFDTHDDSVNGRIIHTYNNNSNDTFFIVDTGDYRVSYGISFLDSAALPNNIIAIRLINNNVEVEGSVFEKDTTKQNSLGTLYRSVTSSFNSGDKIKLQFVSNDTSVSMRTEATYGDHPTSANINVHRVG